MAMLLPALDLWRETSRWDAPPRIVQTHPCGPGDGMTNPMVRSLVPGILPENILANIPKTKQDTFFLLDRVQRHLKNSGLKDCQVFDSPQETSAIIQKLIAKVSQKWVRNAKTPTKDLQTFRRAKRHVRRVQYKDKVQVFIKATVPALRASLPQIHGQGFLSKPVAVYPYRPMDTFLGGHRVNVYRQRNRFDVIDALCGIPILAGLTRRGLKKVVTW